MPTLVDPKKRVRQASQECVAILAAFMGPTKAAPLIRSIGENFVRKRTLVKYQSQCDALQAVEPKQAG